MATVTYKFEPTDVVWVITPSGAVCNSGILTGTVIQVRINILTAGSPSSDVIKYDIRIEGNHGTTEFDEVDVFATLNEATIEYFDRLGGGSPLIP